MKNKNIFLFLIIIGGFLILPSELFALKKYSVTVIQPQRVVAPVISLVTVLMDGKNKIVWKPQKNENIAYYNIYRILKYLKVVGN